LLAAFVLAASTASALTPHRRAVAPRVTADVALAAPSGTHTFRALAPGEIRFLGQTSAPFVANVPAAGMPDAARASNPASRVINLSSGPAANDSWTDTVIVASPRSDSRRIDAILTDAVVRIALEQP
jgi:hypothetical protein